MVIWKIPGTRQPNNVFLAGYGIKCHGAGHPSPSPEYPLGVTGNSVPIPALGGTTELEAGGVKLEGAKRKQSMEGCFYALLNSF